MILKKRLINQNNLKGKDLNMKILEHIRGYKHIFFLICVVLFLTITFETTQQLYYIKRFNLANDDVSYFFLLKSQAYRWLIWVVLSGFIFWFLKSKPIRPHITINDIIKYSSLIIGLTMINIIIISISQMTINGDPFSFESFVSDYLQFFMYQKAPMYILGYIAITVIMYMFIVNEQLQIKIHSLSELKSSHTELYNRLKQKADDKTSILNIKVGNKRKIIPVNDVLWIEADDYCVKVHTTDKQCYTMRSSLKALSIKLDTNFLRVHRKAIANMNMIKELSLSQSPNLILNDNTEIPVSKSHLKTVRDFLSND